MKEVEADPAAKVAWDVKQAAKKVREEARKAKQVRLWAPRLSRALSRRSAEACLCSAA